MSYEKRDNSGTLGKNKNRTEENHPEYAGNCTIGGVSYWINAWIKENRESGEKFFSLSFKPRKTLSQGSTKVEVAPEINDDIPF